MCKLLLLWNQVNFQSGSYKLYNVVLPLFCIPKYKNLCLRLGGFSICSSGLVTSIVCTCGLIISWLKEQLWLRLRCNMHVVLPFNFDFSSLESDLIVWIRLDPAPNVSKEAAYGDLLTSCNVFFHGSTQNVRRNVWHVLYMGHNFGMLMLLKGQEESPAVVPYTLLHCWWLKFQCEPDLSFLT